jgi:hypothetical protein
LRVALQVQSEMVIQRTQLSELKTLTLIFLMEFKQKQAGKRGLMHSANDFLTG